MDWKHLFDSLGLDGTRWQWRVVRWQRQWEDRKANLWGKKQHVTYQHKFCGACGALVDRSDKVCPQCGEKIGSWRAQSTARAFGLIVPSASLATPIVLVSCIGTMLVIMWQYGGAALLDPPNEALGYMGSLIPLLVFDGEYWRLITYGYLHGGLLHIGFNLFALSQVGTMLEKEVGTARYFTLYTLALIGGGIADLMFHSKFVPVVGASGALFGLIGFGITYCHFSGGSLRAGYRGFFITWAIYGFIFGFVMPGVDNICHAGGFVTGALLGFLVERERLNRDRLTPFWRAAGVALALATVGAFVWMLAEGGGQAGFLVM